MNKLDIVKTVLGFVASTSVGLVVRNLVSKAGVSGTGGLNTIGIAFGTLVISEMVAGHAVKHVDAQVDEIANLVNFG